MIKFSLATAAALLITASAHAALIPIDEFLDAQIAEDVTVDGNAVTAADVTYEIGGNTITRGLSVNLVTALNPGISTAQVVDGVLDIRNGAGDIGVVTLTYDVDELTDDVLALEPVTSLAFLFNVVNSDANPITIGATLNGVLLDTFVLPGNLENTLIDFGFNNAADVQGDLVLTITGDRAYDLVLDALGLLVNQRIETPAPAGVALFGLGLLALGLRRR